MEIDFDFYRSGFEIVKSRSKVSNALPRNKNIFNHNTRRAFVKGYVFCLSHGPYRIGLAYQLRYHYRLELFSVVRPLPATGSVVSTVFVRSLCSLYIRTTYFHCDSILLIKGIKYDAHFNLLMFSFSLYN